MVDAADLLPACLRLADRIARHSSIAVTASLRGGHAGHQPADRRRPGGGSHAVHDRPPGSLDAREGSRAFVEKRPAVFRGA
ncbi:hypothetical protein ACU4HD_28880 [Cupriavidus basilensis]